MKKHFILALLLITSSNTYANLLTNGFNVRYDVSYNGMDVGSNNRSLIFSDKTHAVFTSIAIPEGLAALILKEIVTETSSLEITPSSIRPDKYTFKKDKKGKIEQYNLNFNWPNHEFFSSHENKTFHAPENTQDMLSFMLYIMQALQNNRSDFTLPIAAKNKLRVFEVTKTGEELLVLDSGKFNTLKIEHFDKDKKERFTLWCAPSLNYLPVKIVKLESDGDKITFFLNKLQ